jgi:hypothetical protein
MTEIAENLREALQKTELPQEKVDAWITSTAQTTKNTQEQVAQTFLKCLNSIKQGNLSNETYLNRLFSLTIGEIASGLNLKITKIGFYPRITRKDGKVSGEMLGIAKIGDRNAHLLIIAHGEKNVQKLSDLEQFKTYRTQINPKKVSEVYYKCWSNDGTTFAQVDSYLTEEQILKQYQTVILSNARGHLAGFEPESKDFVNKSHISRVENVLIGKVNLQDKWALLGLNDSTFIGTHERPHFPAWIDHINLRLAGIGEGSFVNLLGTFELDNKGKPCLQVCNIQPLLKRPLRETVSGLTSDNVRVLNINI